VQTDVETTEKVIGCKGGVYAVSVLKKGCSS